MEFNPKVFNYRTLREINDDEYAIMLGLFGNRFLRHYINEAEIDDIYTRRIENMYTGNDHKGNSVYMFKFKNIPTEVQEFQNYDKLKLIDALGVKKFVRKFYFPITMDIIQYSYLQGDEDAPIYKPEYLEYLKDNITTEYLVILEDLIIDYFHQSKDTKDKIFELWEYFDYNFRGYPEKGQDIGFFDIFENIKYNPCEVESMEGHIHEIPIYELLEMTRQLEFIMHSVIDDIRGLMPLVPLYNNYRDITFDHDLINRRYDLEDRVIKLALENFIYFYNHNNPGDMQSEGILFTPLFYKESSAKFRTKDSYFEYLAKGEFK